MFNIKSNLISITIEAVRSGIVQKNFSIQRKKDHQEAIDKLPYTRICENRIWTQIVKHRDQDNKSILYNNSLTSVFQWTLSVLRAHRKF